MFKLVDKTKNEYGVLIKETGKIKYYTPWYLSMCVESGTQVEGITYNANRNECTFSIDGAKYIKYNKGYKFRIYPSKEQQILINKTFGCCRLVYNLMLEEKQKYYEATGEYLGTHSISGYKKEREFLKEVDSLALTSEYRNLNTAYKNFFRNSNNAGFPKYKSKKYDKKSYTTYNQQGSIRIEGNKIKLPKVGWVKLRKPREVEGEIKGVVVSKSPSGKYYVSLSVEAWCLKYTRNINKYLGMDLGLNDLVTIAQQNGVNRNTRIHNKIENPKYLDLYLLKLKREQKKLSRKQKGSSRYEKQRIKVAKVHEKIRNIRLDNIHKITTDIVRENTIIISEDLSVKSLMESKYNKKIKRTRRIGDAGWSEFMRQLEYKSKWYNSTYKKIDRYYSSTQLCNNCGYKNTKLKNSTIRVYICPKCGKQHDRDINAANNILDRGLELLGVA